jgi:hypothetical protein
LGHRFNELGYLLHVSQSLLGAKTELNVVYGCLHIIQSAERKIASLTFREACSKFKESIFKAGIHIASFKGGECTESDKMDDENRKSIWDFWVNWPNSVNPP